VLAAALAAYFAAHDSLPGLSKWPDVVVLGFVIMPAVFGLVWLLLPFWDASWLPWAGGACVLLVVAFELLSWEALASFAKLGAATFLAW
jgi:hypothetical protein